MARSVLLVTALLALCFASAFAKGSEKKGPKVLKP